MAWKTISEGVTGLTKRLEHLWEAWSPQLNEKVKDGFSDSANHRKVVASSGPVFMGMAGKTGAPRRQKISVGGKKSHNPSNDRNDRGPNRDKGAHWKMIVYGKKLRSFIFTKHEKELKESQEFWRARGRLNRILQDMAVETSSERKN